MKLLLVCLCMAFNFACGTNETLKVSECNGPKEPTVRFESEELVGYANTFYQDGREQGIDVNLSKLKSLEFKDGNLLDDKNVIGVCFKKINDKTGELVWSRIEISSRWWNGMEPVYRSVLMHHEFAHCSETLARKHYDKSFRVDGQWYFSIMTTYLDMSYPEDTMKNWPILLDELFHPEYYHGASLSNETFVHEDHCFVTANGEEACPITYGIAFR